MLEMVQNGAEELEAEPTDAQRVIFKYSKKKDYKTLFNIQQNVDAHLFENISKVSKSKEVWDILEKYHNGGEKGE